MKCWRRGNPLPGACLPTSEPTCLPAPSPAHPTAPLPACRAISPSVCSSLARPTARCLPPASPPPAPRQPDARRPPADPPTRHFASLHDGPPNAPARPPVHPLPTDNPRHLDDVVLGKDVRDCLRAREMCETHCSNVTHTTPHIYKTKKGIYIYIYINACANTRADVNGYMCDTHTCVTHIRIYMHIFVSKSRARVLSMQVWGPNNYLSLMMPPHSETSLIFSILHCVEC